MKLSTTFWVIVILLLIGIGEGFYIYYTRPKPDPELSIVKAENKAKDSLLAVKDSTIVALTARLVFTEEKSDEVYEQKKALSESLADAGAIMNDYSDSLDYYRAKLDTPHFVVACDSLQTKADSLVLRTHKYDSIIKVGDSYMWLVGKQKDSISDNLRGQVIVLKAHDSVTEKRLEASIVARNKETKSNKALVPVYVGGGVVGGVLLTALVHFVIK